MEQYKGKQSPGKVLLDSNSLFLLNEGGENRVGTTVQSGWVLPFKDGGGRTPLSELEANAALYAEAHSVANETGMWPRDMVAEIERLKRLLDKSLAQTDELIALCNTQLK